MYENNAEAFRARRRRGCRTGRRRGLAPVRSAAALSGMGALTDALNSLRNPPRSRAADRHGPVSTAPGEHQGIIDRAALSADLAALAASGLSQDALRAAVLARLKDALDTGRREIRRRFQAGGSGALTARANCFLVDRLIQVIHTHVIHTHVATAVHPQANLAEDGRTALIALGGYGRGELAPESDVDLLFLHPHRMTPHHERVIEAMLYLLWDLGFKVGQAIRSPDLCIRLAKSDMTIRTSLLEMRFVCGDRPLFQSLKRSFTREVRTRSAAKFIEAKLGECDERHRRMGDSRYVLEPNIKDGKGGLRDLHALLWITRHIHQVEDTGDLVAHQVEDIDGLVERGVFTRPEVRRFKKAQDFLWTLRCHLHYIAGRPEERLTFDLQQEIAPLMGYSARAGSAAVERLMKHYFLVAKDVGDLTRIFRAALEEGYGRRPGLRLSRLNRRRVERFRIEGKRLTVPETGTFAETPIEMLRIFKVAQAHDLDIHPDALRGIARNLKRIDKTLRADPEANRIFLDILTAGKNPESTLRRMNEAGVLGRFVPDFGRVVAQMQYNMYHHFTVDEHTLFAIGILHRIEQGLLKDEAPIATHVIHEVLSRRELYLAVLLHDIAKGRGGDHSERGARVARAVCPRLGLDEEETETVAWLVRHHLAMSDTAFRRDLDDPITIQKFADLVQSVERLRLLLVLTVADIRAVGPGTWNAWKAALLRDLFWRAEEVLSGQPAAAGRDGRVGEAKDAVGKALSGGAALSGWSAKALKTHLSRGPAAYWLSFDRDTLARHASMIRKAEIEDSPLAVETRADHYREVIEVTVYTADKPGVFSLIAGAIAAAGGSIDAAKIFTLANATVLDSFYVRDVNGGPFDNARKRARLSAAIEKALAGQMDPLAELARQRSPIQSRYQVFNVAPRVLFDNQASDDTTVIEINGRDRPGLLYRVTQALTALKLNIRTAKISTYGERAVDAFYVTDSRGRKLTGEARQEKIRETLLQAIAGQVETR